MDRQEAIYKLKAGVIDKEVMDTLVATSTTGGGSTGGRYDPTLYWAYDSLTVFYYTETKDKLRVDIPMTKELWGYLYDFAARAKDQ